MAEQAQESKTLYGPRKLGDEAFAKQEEEQTRSHREATVYGSRKGDPEPVAPAKPDPDNPFEAIGDEDSSGYVTLSELSQVLSKRPQLLDAAIEAEYRNGSPRKGAITLFLDIEQQRKGGPRDEVIDRLTAPQSNEDEDTDE